MSPNSTHAPGTTQNLGGKRDIIGTPRIIAMPIDVDVDTFVEVYQIAHEVVMDATKQPPIQAPHSLSITIDVIGDASKV